MSNAARRRHARTLRKQAMLGAAKGKQDTQTTSMEDAMQAVAAALGTGDGKVAVPLKAPRNASKALRAAAASEASRLANIASLAQYQASPYIALQKHLEAANGPSAPLTGLSAGAPSPSQDSQGTGLRKVQHMSAAPYVSRRKAAGQAVPGQRKKARGGQQAAATRGRVRRAKAGGSSREHRRAAAARAGY